MKRFRWLAAVFVLAPLAGSTGCSMLGLEKADTSAQSIVDGIVAKNPDVVRLTIHAIPTGGAESKIIACNLAERIGRASDPEDLNAMKTGNSTVLKEGENLDYTAPIRDAAGKTIAATGITLAGPKAGESEADRIAKAENLAKEIQAAVQAAGKTLW